MDSSDDFQDRYGGGIAAQRAFFEFVPDGSGGIGSKRTPADAVTATAAKRGSAEIRSDLGQDRPDDGMDGAGSGAFPQRTLPRAYEAADDSVERWVGSVGTDGSHQHTGVACGGNSDAGQQSDGFGTAAGTSKFQSDVSIDLDGLHP